VANGGEQPKYRAEHRLRQPFRRVARRYGEQSSRRPRSFRRQKSGRLQAAWTIGLRLWQFHCLAFRRNPHDSPGEPAALERSDQPTAGIDLESPEAVERRGGKSVMVVVPRLAEGQPGEPPDVA